MNKIIIVGHSASGFEKIEALLLKCGMSSALPSRREGVTPLKLSAVICKAYHAPSIEIPTLESDFKQLEVGPIWQGLTLDFLLGNAGQELWGWADTRSIFLLDYWCKIDPLATFVLVYDEPHRVLLERSIGRAGAIDESHIRQRLENWAAYNAALLKFYQCNSDRCLLVQSQQVEKGENLCLSQLQKRLPAPLDGVAPELVMKMVETDADAAADHSSSSAFTESLGTELGSSEHLSGESLSDLNASDTEYYLIDRYLADNPDFTRLYKELQAVANIPLDPQHSAMISSTLAWKGLLRQRQLTSEIVETTRILSAQNNRFRQDQNLLLSKLKFAQEQLESGFRELQCLRENLRQSTEALRRIESTPLNTGNQTAAGMRGNLDPPLLGAAERVKQQLSYRLGSVVVSKSKSPLGILCLPVSLVGEFRGFRSEQRNRKRTPLPAISLYADADQAERVRKQLSYRLGKTMVDHSKSPVGWIAMPFAVIREIRNFNSKRS